MKQILFLITIIILLFLVGCEDSLVNEIDSFGNELDQVQARIDKDKSNEIKEILNSWSSEEMVDPKLDTNCVELARNLVPDFLFITNRIHGVKGPEDILTFTDGSYIDQRVLVKYLTNEQLQSYNDFNKEIYAHKMDNLRKGSLKGENVNNLYGKSGMLVTYHKEKITNAEGVILGDNDLAFKFEIDYTEIGGLPSDRIYVLNKTELTFLRCKIEVPEVIPTTPPFEVTSESYYLIVKNNQDKELNLEIEYRRFSSWFSIDEKNTINVSVLPNQETRIKDEYLANIFGCKEYNCQLKILSYKELN